MRVRQLILSRLLCPSDGICYNRYPGFLAPITMAEILRDIAKAQAFMEQSHAHLGLSSTGGWQKQKAAMLCDAGRSNFSVHGGVCSFFELDDVPEVSKAIRRTEELQFEADLTTWTPDESRQSIISVILPALMSKVCCSRAAS